MKRPIESVSGHREGPLPAEVPRDEDHLDHPRDLAAVRAAEEITLTERNQK